MTNYIRHLSWHKLLLLCGLLLLAAITPARAEVFLLQLSADPPRVPYLADTVNRTTIRVMVRDSEGRPAANLTTVYFKTTLGTIPDQAKTQNGMVAVQLENYQFGPGTATIYVEVGGSQASMQVEFFGQPGAEETPPVEARPSYRMRAQQIYYSVTQRVFDLSYCKSFRAPGGLVLQADALQFTLDSYIVTAQRSITITINDKSYHAEGLHYNLQTKVGVMLQSDENMQSHYFTIEGDAFNLTEVPQEDWNQYLESFLPPETRPTKTWIVMRQATVFPNDQIQFKNPSFYLDGSRTCLLRLPYHVISYYDNSEFSFLNMTLGLTTDGGIDADFPFYYAANATHIGSLHLRNVTKNSTFYRGDSGLQLSLEEEYYAGANGDGTLYIDDLLRSTRSLDWDHVHQFGKLHSSFGASYTRNDAKNPYATRGYLTLSRPLGQVNASLSTNFSEYNKSSSSFAEMSFYLPSLQLWKSAYSLGFAPYFGWRGLKASSTADQTLRSNELNYQGLRTSLMMPSYRVFQGIFSPYVSDQVLHDSSGKLSNTFDGGLRYQRPLFHYFTASLSYSYSHSFSNRDTAPQEALQRLSLDLFGSGNNWNLYGYSSYNLNDESLFSSANLEYRLPWLKSDDNQRKLFFRASSSINISANGSNNNDSFFTIGRQLGDYTLLVHYSPSGNNAVTGIGTGTGQKWAFEFVRM